MAHGRAEPAAAAVAGRGDTRPVVDEDAVKRAVESFLGEIPTLGICGQVTPSAAGEGEGSVNTEESQRAEEGAAPSTWGMVGVEHTTRKA